jgi:plasmid stability protein
MPTVVLESVPPEVYERLQKRAAARHRSLPEEMLDLLVQALRAQEGASTRLPDLVIGGEIPAPCDLPRSSQPEQVRACAGGPHLDAPQRGEGKAVQSNEAQNQQTTSAKNRAESGTA